MKLNIRILFLSAVALFILLNGSVASAFYDPVLGRWLNRDPLGENGFEVSRGGELISQSFPNLYVFVDNRPLSSHDSWGLSPCTDRCDKKFKQDTDNCNKYAKRAAVICAISGGAAGAGGGLMGGAYGVIGGATILGGVGAAGGGFATWFVCNAAANYANGACYAGCLSIGPNAP